MEQKYYDAKNNRIVFINENADSKFWDKHWQKNDIENIYKRIILNRMVIAPTKKFIKKGGRIIDGGCGVGQNVKSLENNGYESYGVDYAKSTVESVNRFIPALKVSRQDIRKLNFPDGFFDGYWSLGVIEHFYNGYEDIIKEIKRVLKKDGYLFITFPCISKLRRKKIQRGRYEIWNEKENLVDKFYQFALDENSVENVCKKYRFEMIEKKNVAGLKGFKDEINTKYLKRILQKIYNSELIFSKAISWCLDNVLRPYSGHAKMMIFKSYE